MKSLNDAREKNTKMCVLFLFSVCCRHARFGTVKRIVKNEEKQLKYRKRALSAENPSPSFGCSTSGRSTHENIFRFSLVSFLLFPEPTTGDRTGERVEFDERRKSFLKIFTHFFFLPPISRIICVALGKWMMIVHESEWENMWNFNFLFLISLLSGKADMQHICKEFYGEIKNKQIMC